MGLCYAKGGEARSLRCPEASPSLGLKVIPVAALDSVVRNQGLKTLPWLFSGCSGRQSCLETRVFKSKSNSEGSPLVLPLVYKAFWPGGGVEIRGLGDHKLLLVYKPHLVGIPVFSDQT